MDNSSCGLDGKSDHCWRYGNTTRKCAFCGKIQYRNTIWEDKQQVGD